jgi:hypothetical protein
MLHGPQIRPFQYIPVRENFVIDSANSRLALESSVGPFEFFIKGQVFGWDGATGMLDFQFNDVDIKALGKPVGLAAWLSWIGLAWLALEG